MRRSTINVREHSLAKVPVMLVVGRREAENRTVAVRRLSVEEQPLLPLSEIVSQLAHDATPPDLRDKETAQ